MMSTSQTTDAQSSSLNVLDTTNALDPTFAAIDWQAPWLNHLNQLDYLSHRVKRLSNRTKQTDTPNINPSYNTTIIAELLNTALTQQHKTLPPQTKPTQNNQAQALQFVAQDTLPEGEAYESFISSTGNIPTRDNLHDLFNGSIWLTFPKTKALLNYHHMGQIAVQGIRDIRGRVRDTITVFDENGAILVTSEPQIGEAVINFDWQASLVSPRDNWENLRQPNKEAKAAVYIFGHALLEQLIQPRKPLCAHSVIINVTPDFFTLSLPDRLAYIDNKLAEHMYQLLSQDDITPRNLSPLPILGVPHFWDDNANPEFYKDSDVFRSGRRQQV
ncbi:DUF3025 domain-containing protein [Psychrobacter sp. CAL346-MNA-CIBAN-0220]|uniref:DUF3025 domain-containing protein n=1 Tax=Psychrobacter sp. CAL346-MNA-CIBAN-0220 TaxID=3140457 RepID=UPI00332B1DE7